MKVRILKNLDKVNEALKKGANKNADVAETIPEELPLEVTMDDEEEMSEEEYREYLQLQYEELAIPPTDVITVLNPINPNKKCGNCQFFAEDTREIVRGFLEDNVSFVAGIRYGSCRANPPETNPDFPEGTAVFPTVPEYLWCGKWDLTTIPPQPPAPMEEPPEDESEGELDEAYEDVNEALEAEMSEEAPAKE